MNLRKIESGMIETASRIAPILAPVPTAYLVTNAAREHLGWPLAVAVIAGVIVEGVGLSTTATALELRQYNRAKRKTDPQAPVMLAVLLVAVYFFVATGLTVLMDIIPGLVVYAPAIFPLLSLVGVTLLAIRLDHAARLDAIRQDKLDRKAARTDRTNRTIGADKPDRLSGASGQAGHASGQADTNPDTADKLLSAYRTDPYASASEVARQTGLSRQAVYRRLEKLEQAGVIHRNGNGVRVR